MSLRSSLAEYDNNLFELFDFKNSYRDGIILYVYLELSNIYLYPSTL